MMCGLVSCKSVKRLIGMGNTSEKALTEERRKGLNYVKLSSPDEVDRWKQEPNVLVLTDYFDEGSKECLETAKYLDSLASKYGDKLVILRINVSDSPALKKYARSKGINRFPSMEMHLNGRKMDKVLGSLNYDALEGIVSGYVDGIPDSIIVRDDFKKPIVVAKHKGELPPGVERVKIPENTPDLSDRLPNNVIEPSSVEQ